jgi:hypothetical protein
MALQTPSAPDLIDRIASVKFKPEPGHAPT